MLADECLKHQQKSKRDTVQLMQSSIAQPCAYNHMNEPSYNVQSKHEASLVIDPTQQHSSSGGGRRWPRFNQIPPLRTKLISLWGMLREIMAWNVSSN